MVTLTKLLVLWLLMPVVSMGAACGDSLPTRPTAPATPQVSITVVPANASIVSLSETVVCSGDWTTCPKGPQPQGPSSSGMVLVRQYTLTPGTYRVTGVLQPGTSAGASLQVRIGGGIIGSMGFVAFSGQPEPPPSLVTELCGGRFTAGTGTLEWSVTFSVADQTNRDDPCL